MGRHAADLKHGLFAGVAALDHFLLGGAAARPAVDVFALVARLQGLLQPDGPVRAARQRRSNGLALPRQLAQLVAERRHMPDVPRPQRPAPPCSIATRPSQLSWWSDKLASNVMFIIGTTLSLPV